VKSGPDVFADALVPIAEVLIRRFDFPAPGTQHPTPAHRPSMRAQAREAAFVHNGYRSTKPEGKSSSAIARQTWQKHGICGISRPLARAARLHPVHRDT
jgi:hypothetical protein